MEASFGFLTWPPKSSQHHGCQEMGNLCQMDPLWWVSFWCSFAIVIHMFLNKILMHAHIYIYIGIHTYTYMYECIELSIVELDSKEVKQDPRGVAVKTLKPGDGRTFAEAGDRVTVHYIGRRGPSRGGGGGVGVSIPWMLSFSGEAPFSGFQEANHTYVDAYLRI